MRIGLVVDGQSEFSALRKLKPQIEAASGNVIVGVVKADIHPKAPTARIARVALENIAVLQVKNVEQAIVLIDREDRHECPGVLAELVLDEIQPRAPVPVAVVIKDRMFENWLVSDVHAIRELPARFSLSDSIVNSIQPNKADHVDADSVLRTAAVNRAYEKDKDAGRILEQADVFRMAANSRSFRKFLRCVGHPTYADQSERPVGASRRMARPSSGGHH